MSDDASSTIYGEEFGERTDIDESNALPLTKVLTSEEAASCLDLLGKDESGLRYTYLMMSATNRRLTDITVITTYKHLLFVNVSKNRLFLEDIQCLAQLPFLLLLQADTNKIESCELISMKYLQVLTLNHNRIEYCRSLVQPLLECLELSYNMITDPSDLHPSDLPCLKLLELRGNAIKTLHGLHFKTLDSLYLAENKIKRILDLSSLTNLRILHLRQNNISRLRGFSSKLGKLQYVNLRKNKIEKVLRFQKLRCLPKLDTLIVLQNPICGPDPVPGEEEEPIDEEAIGALRLQILLLLPNLKRINKEPVTIEERDEASEMREEQGEFVEEEESEDEDTPEDTLDYGEGEFSMDDDILPSEPEY